MLDKINLKNYKFSYFFILLLIYKTIITNIICNYQDYNKL